MKQHPQIVFVKPLKTGSGSVAMALNNAVVENKIQHVMGVKEVYNREFRKELNCSTPLGSIYFHHGFKNTWSKKW
jgi:hypothetical protein